MYLAKVYVSLKPTVNDPQGLTIKGALQNLGFSDVNEVRAGKYIEIKMKSDNLDHARNQLDQMCRQLLSNPVIETYRFDVIKLDEAELLQIISRDTSGTAKKS